MRVKKEPRGSSRAGHPGYRVADRNGESFLMEKVWPPSDYEGAEREACAAGGIVVKADWPAREPKAPLEDVRPGVMGSPQDWLEEGRGGLPPGIGPRV